MLLSVYWLRKIVASSKLSSRFSTVRLAACFLSSRRDRCTSEIATRLKAWIACVACGPEQRGLVAGSAFEWVLHVSEFLAGPDMSASSNCDEHAFCLICDACPVRTVCCHICGRTGCSEGQRGLPCRLDSMTDSNQASTSQAEGSQQDLVTPRGASSDGYTTAPSPGSSGASPSPNKKPLFTRAVRKARDFT